MRYYDLDGRAINLDDIASVGPVFEGLMWFDQGDWRSSGDRYRTNSFLFRVTMKFGAPVVEIGEAVPYDYSTASEEEHARRALVAMRVKVLRDALVAGWTG